MRGGSRPAGSATRSRATSFRRSLAFRRSASRECRGGSRARGALSLPPTLRARGRLVTSLRGMHPTRMPPLPRLPGTRQPLHTQEPQSERLCRGPLRPRCAATADRLVIWAGYGAMHMTTETAVGAGHCCHRPERDHSACSWCRAPPNSAGRSGASGGVGVCAGHSWGMSGEGPRGRHQPRRAPTLEP